MKKSLLVVGGFLSSSLMSSLLSSESVQLAAYQVYSKTQHQHSLMASQDASIGDVKFEFVSHLDHCKATTQIDRNEEECRD